MAVRDGALSAAAKRHLQLEATLRELSGLLEKGVVAVDSYAASHGETATLASARGGNGTVRAVQRFMLAIGHPASVALPRSLTLRAAPVQRTRRLQAGNTPVAADGRGVVLVPFQAASNRFVLSAYVKTPVRATVYRRGASPSDITRYDLGLADYRLTINGLNAARLSVRAEDPLTGRAIGVRILKRSGRKVVLELPLTSYPRLLMLSDAKPTRPGQSTMPPLEQSAPPPSPASAAAAVPFAASSPWLTPVPSNAPLDPSSAGIVADLGQQIQSNYGHAALNTTSYSAPIYTVPAAAPTVNVAYDNCQNKSGPEDPGLARQFQNVPIPAGAVASVGTDEDMVIWQPSTDTEWELWKAQQDSTGAWSACWGGRINNVSQNPGIFPSPYGTSASGLPMLAYLIRLSELHSGHIDHALGLSVPAPRNTHSWPANRTDGLDTNSFDPAEGERFRLNPAFDISTLPLGERIIAAALQRYGAIITDTSGTAAIQAEDPRPINGGQAVYDHLFPGNLIHLPDIPWNQMQALAWNYGMPTSV